MSNPLTPHARGARSEVALKGAILWVHEYGWLGTFIFVLAIVVAVIVWGITLVATEIVASGALSKTVEESARRYGWAAVWIDLGLAALVIGWLRLVRWART